MSALCTGRPKRAFDHIEVALPPIAAFVRTCELPPRASIHKQTVCRRTGRRGSTSGRLRRSAWITSSGIRYNELPTVASDRWRDRSYNGRRTDGRCQRQLRKRSDPIGAVALFMRVL